ncbi:MAG: hypothetical protein PHD83_06310, partial [Caldisericia bacterium]|nr:hypothetical protein [Caldisericia bacterium]
MKRLLSLMVIGCLFVSGFSVYSGSKTATGAPKNIQATFVANRFVKLGFDRDGLPLYPARMFPWQKTQDIQVWGRDGIPMPHAFNAQNEGVNVPALEGVNDVVPVMWTDFYLTVSPEGG